MDVVKRVARHFIHTLQLLTKAAWSRAHVRAFGMESWSRLDWAAIVFVSGVLFFFVRGFWVNRLNQPPPLRLGADGRRILRSGPEGVSGVVSAQALWGE